MKIRCFVAVILGVILIGAAVLLTVGTKQNNSGLLQEYAKKQLENETEKLAMKLTMFISGNMDNIVVLSDKIAQIEKENWDQKELGEFLQKASTQMQYFDMNLCGTDGKGIDLTGREQKVDFCSYYKSALMGDTTVAISSFYEGSTSDSMIYTTPIRDNGEIVGVLRASMELEVLQSMMSTITFRGKEDIYLLKRNGAIITEIPEENNTDFFSLIKMEDDSFSQLQQVIKQGKSILTEASIDGEVCYLSFNGIKNIKEGGVMLTIPRDQLLSLFEFDEKVNLNNWQLILLLTVIISTIALATIALMESIGRLRVQDLAYYDDVTESINYNGFRKEALAQLHKPVEDEYAIVEISIDRFDYIKAFFGTQEGKRIFKFISKVLKENMKEGELFCRFNTDYFLLFLSYHSKEELANRLSFLDIKMSRFDEKDKENDKYELKLHYGIYCIEEDVDDIDVMVSRAYLALLQVKNDRKQPYEFYSNAMQSRILDEKEIEEHMYTALEEKEFLVYLQPKYDLNTGLQVGAEALVRWMHPDKGLMYPGRFIGVFEKNGFIVKLDMYILDVLCHRLKIWMSKGYRPMPLSINISRLNLFDENFVDNIESTLERYGIPANLIEIEIAEEVVTDNIELLSSLIIRLKEYGFLISMDDFGTGTTSMSTLYNVPVDELKLDRKFLLGAEKTDRGKNVIKSIIELAKRLDIKVVSEGVENKSQAQMLKELGCDMIQGYVFSDPLPIREYEDYAYGPNARENKIW